MNLTRSQILKGNFIYPKELIKLWRTTHFNQRLEERGVGLTCIPTVVRPSIDNIHSGKTEDGLHLSNIVVRLDYKADTYLFLCFNPIDGGLKTLWFKSKDYKNENNRTHISYKNSR